MTTSTSTNTSPELAKAIERRDFMRNLARVGRTAKVRRDAAEELTFWQGRVAMLLAEEGWA